MADLTNHERALLRALSELEPATLEELGVRTGIPKAQVKEILEALAKKGLLSSLDDESDSIHENSSPGRD